MSITEACYEQALNRLLPLISSLASDGDHGHATAADLERLQQDLVEKDAKLNALTKECENTQRMNAALLEENAMLKADIEALNRRTSNLELCQTPRSEDTIRLSEFPLLSPATEIDGGDSYLGTSGIPSVAVSSPVLNYAEITMQNVSREPDTTAQRIHSGVIQAEALLNTVKQRRLAARSSMSSVKSTAIKSSRSLPEITGYTSLWYDFNRAFDADPKTTACLKIQRLWRGYVARKKLKNIKHRLMIVNEVLDTEASYVRGLLVLHKEYMLPLQEEKDEKSHSITPTDFDNMFGHLSEIMQFSQRLLDSMVDRVAYWHHEQCFGDIFIDAAESMKIYAHYINNYDLAMETLQRLLDNFTFAKRLQSLEKAASRSHDLKDLLITPVQRPPRYLLLLQELLKRTPEKHPDYENLVSAVKRIKRTVHTINERKKRHESMRKLHEAVRGSPIHLVATNRYMVFSGPVLELNERSTGVNDLKYHRHLLLFNDLLLCASPTSNITETNSANPEATQYDFKWALPLADIVTVIERDSNCFQVAWKAGASSGIRILYTRNQEEHTDWVKHFAHARKNQIRLSRQSTLEGAGLILPPTHLVVKTATRRKSLQTINQTIERLESEIQEEAKVIEGFQLLENLNSTKPESATKSAKSVPGPIKALATPFAPVIKSHNRPMLSWDRENWIGLLPGVKKLSRTLSLRGQRDESEKKLGVLKREVSRHQLLRQQLQTPPPLG
ncbi:uncharacterized protein EV422DRAFT_566869 [Fimicolochytrium jonesii]|uniref:uncharacterized protein n=1 Tax=Fimicolochytrium jonesii TaxID=1396493 RepID=UPI0022FEB40B|nr:uncharacterized protein EV422DRAFT_566869 [Fimicolochytrium jonesii]KAI8821789.1 hypothetical protein EV422DRAFT_566869 [Fimicolochytrium jonesii]